jgi:hypothetical protein
MKSNAQGEGFDWNMNLGFLMQLDGVMTKCHELRQLGTPQGNYSWYNALRGIYGMIHFKIKEPGQEKEEARLNLLFNQAREFLSGRSKANGLSIALDTLDEIEILLRDLVVEYRIVELFTEKRDPAEAILEKFKNG